MNQGYYNIITMEYKKTNLLDNELNEPSEYRIKYWVEVNDESRGGYYVNSQIKLKTAILKFALCD